jgi:hypothetical protein
MPTEIRLALTLPGAVSLGAFEAGAVAALGVGLGALGKAGEQPDAPSVRLDVIGAASVGALTGLLLARSLLEGGDPVASQEQSWGRDASLRALRGRGWSAPLSYRGIRRRAPELLHPSLDGRLPGQRTPVRLAVGLTNLRGLAYRLPEVSGPPVVTHLDWIELRLEAGVDTADLLRPPGGSTLDVVLASAANQLAFLPELLTRTDDRARYQIEGVVNFPASGRFWYADAALLDREPLARTLRLARKVDDEEKGDFRRVHVLVRPQPQRAGTGNAWADPRERPRWAQVLGRSVAIQQAQSIFDDLSGMQQTNTRLAAIDTLAAALGPVVSHATPEVQASLRVALDGLRGDDPRAAEEEPIEALLTTALGRVADVAGKHQVRVESIVPPDVGSSASQTAGRAGPDDALAGAGLFRFAGFLDQRFRRHDFAVGYDSALRWLADGGLTRHGLTALQREAMTTAMRGRRPAPVHLPNSRLTLRAAWAALELTGRMGLVALHDLAVGPRGAADVHPPGQRTDEQT